MNNRVSSERWDLAQESEKNYWKQFTTTSLFKKWGNVYKERASSFLKEIAAFIKVNKNTKILQIGSGPLDIINFLPSLKKHSIDPLADFYKERFKFNYSPIDFKKAIGEKIPYPNKYFDIVVSINVLDHMHMPEKSLLEARRVLKDSGIFYLSCYTYQKNFIRIARIWSLIKRIFARKIYNIHHPFMFTKESVKNLALKEFKVVYENYGRDIGVAKSLEELKRKQKHAKSLKKRMLAFLGFYGIINYTCICKKK